ncbi:MAG TPA: flagellin [Methanoregula sp.]|nr:flagellin [Methanoregula sp.]
MSSDTFTTAMFLITAVLAAGVLINAVFPVVYQMAGTFQSATHASDVRLRTDVTIITTFSSGSPSLSGQVWLKNIGSQPIAKAELNSSDVFFGPVGSFHRLDMPADLGNGYWTYSLSDINGNGYWDPGETLEIDAYPPAGGPAPSGTLVYFQFVLPTGVSRSVQFTVS